MLALEATDLGRRFGARWLFRGLQLGVPAGGSLAVVGPSGCGKSTLLRVLVGQLLPTAGEVRYTLAGAPLPAERLYTQLDWAAPALELHPALTLLDTYTSWFALKRCRLPALVPALEALGLAGQRHQPVGQLSSGQLQRARVGLALFASGALLVLDEPTTHLDAATAEQLLGLIAQHRGGRTLLLASNLPREREALAPQQVLHLPQ